MMATPQVYFGFRARKTQEFDNERQHKSLVTFPLSFPKTNLTGNDMRMTCMRVEANGFHGTILSASHYTMVANVRLLKMERPHGRVTGGPLLKAAPDLGAVFTKGSRLTIGSRR